MSFKSLHAAAVWAAGALVVLSMPATQGQGRRSLPGVIPKSLTELRAQDARVERMRRGGDLRVRPAAVDKLVPGRRIERTDQFHRGVRVFGGDVARQLAGGQTVSVFGTIYDDLVVDTIPSVPEVEARQRVEEAAGVRLGRSRAG